MEIDLVGELPNSNGYRYILTACDVFTRYLFAVPLRTVDSQAIIKALTGIFTQHAYVPKRILTDKGSVFTSETFKDLTKSAGIIINHATLQHARTIGMIERSHKRLKEILKINVAEHTHSDGTNTSNSQ